MTMTQSQPSVARPGRLTPDFSFGAYAALLRAARESDYSLLTVRDYLSMEPLPDRFVVLRHDVDRRPERALAMARLEAKHGVRSTYYVRTVDRTFVPWILTEMESIGHEVGYHYEDLDRCDGDVPLAHASFEAELSRLREHVTVDTACMHGNPLTPHDNREMWDHARQPSDYGLLGEAYLSMDFADVVYFSDTGRTWRDGDLKVKDHPVGENGKRTQVDTTWELIELLEERRLDRACVLTHPERWAQTFPEFVAATLQDTVFNAGKRILRLAG